MTQTKFIEACKKGDISVVKKYINEGGNPSDDDNLAIRWANIFCHIEIVKLLLQDDRFRFTNNLNDYPDIIDIIYQIRQEKIMKLI